jgi:hypothetical protein
MNIAFFRTIPAMASLLVLAIAAQPAAAQTEPACQSKAKSMALPEKIVGLVESVQGSALIVRLDNQTLRRVVVPDAAGVDLGFLQGQRVAIEQQACYLPPTPPIPQGW